MAGTHAGSHGTRRGGPAAASPTKRRDASPLRDRVAVAGLALVLAATVFRAWALHRTWFYLDDFAIINDTARHGLGPQSLFEPYFGHLMPAGRLLAWATAEAGPNNYTFAAAQMLALFAAAGVGMLRLLRTLFGSRSAVLVPLTYFLFSPFLIPATTWWSAGINHLPALVATIFALDAHVRYLRTHRRQHLLATLIWLLAGLMFSEVTLFAYVPIAVVSGGYFASGTLLGRVRQLWDGYRGAVVAHIVLVGSYLALYLSVAWSALDSPASVPWRQYATNVLVDVLPSTVTGGPGGWHRVWAAQFEVHPAWWGRVLGLATLAALFALSAITRDRGLRAWLIPVGQLAGSVVLMGAGRAIFGPDLIRDLRFTTPAALGLALALGLAFLPVVGAVESSTVRERHWVVDRREPALLALAAFIPASMVSTATFPLLHIPADESPRRFFEAFDQSLRQHGTPVTLVEQAVPGFVFGVPDGFYSTALVQYGDQVRVPTVVQDDFYVLDRTGRLVRPGLDVVRRQARPVPNPGCGYRVGPAGRAIPLDGPVYGIVWRLRIAYDAARETPVTITIGDVSTRTVLHEGRHVLEMPGAAAYDRVEVTDLDPAATGCVSRVEVGRTTVRGVKMG